MATLLQDLRYALRMLVRSPIFTAIIIGTLALGIGANTIVFSVVNGILLNPLPYSHSGRLVALYEKNAGIPEAPISYLNFLDWQRGAKSFSSMAIYRHEDFNLTGASVAERVNGLMISSDFLTTLGVRPALGRDFGTSDDHLGAAPVALLSDGYWHRHFAASPAILGNIIQLDGLNYTIVGVLPRGFSFYNVDRDVFVPIGRWDDPSFRDRLVDISSHAIGRLQPGATLAQAQSEMDAIADHLAQEYPEADKNVGINVLSMKQDIVGNVQPILILLLAAVAFLLLIASANVASLLLARAMRRSGEFALRAAIGARRSRIIRQLLTESLLLACTGGALGTLLAIFGTKTLLASLPSALPRSADVALDLRVLLFSLVVSLLCGIGFGLVPAIRSSRVDLQQALRKSTAGAGNSRSRLQRLLISGEVALAVVLLVGAGLMLRSLAALWRVNLGYNPEHAITFSLSLPTNTKTTEAETRARLRQFDAAMRAIPGVDAVSVTLGSRPMIHDSELPFWIKGQPKPTSNNEMPQAMFYLVEDGFQRAMGITLQRGRFVTANDKENFPIVVDIDDAFARTYFPNQNPIGQHIHVVGFDVEAEIIGIVGHIRQWGPTNDPKSAVEPQFFYPFMQMPPKLMHLAANGVAVVIRTREGSGNILPAVRKATTEYDPRAVLYNEQTMDEVIFKALAARRLSMILLTTFAALALALSAVGIYGVISYLAQERTREIGVRIALGASRADVLRLILSQGASMTLFGIALGVALSLGLTRLISNQLFGVAPWDPLTFLSVSFSLLAIALAACYLPARRATRIDPIVALRCE
ncbi:ABC transporter permease [Acidicapsa dinghuensis]|uniref:ABC transporter permease n=1 Tax=Acidicapsa dinghuensis TaxID=2218256 RepID=A0ABW1E8R6_9BACT|nr:ABC transporter permease [Acidicapsa dinghuensis]